MNLFAEAPMWLSWILAAVFALAAVQDAVQLKISNLFPVALMLLAALALVLAGPSLDFWQNLVVFAGLLGVGTALFASGKLGGGDVKLLAATGLWVDFQGALTLLASVFIAGGVLALVIIMARTVAPAQPNSSIKILQPKGGIPYGVAIGAGAMIAAAMARG